MSKPKNEGETVATVLQSPEISQQPRTNLADDSKTQWQNLWPVIACGAGLFSDGYLNCVAYFFLTS